MWTSVSQQATQSCLCCVCNAPATTVFRFRVGSADALGAYLCQECAGLLKAKEWGWSLEPLD